MNDIAGMEDHKTFKNGIEIHLLKYLDVPLVNFEPHGFVECRFDVFYEKTIFFYQKEERVRRFNFSLSRMFNHRDDLQSIHKAR